MNYAKLHIIHQQIPDSEIVKIYEFLKEISIDHHSAKKDHINNVQAKISERNKKETVIKCPYCDGELIKKVGKYGNYLGCSRYPKCKYTKKMRVN